ncbi:MAG: TrmH family RNA methyltransferase [Acidimicrobiales bacterium]
MAEGVEVVRAGMSAGISPEALFVAAEHAHDHEVETLASLAAERGVRCQLLAPGVAANVASTVSPHPAFGIFAMIDTEAASLGTVDLAVVLAEVRDPGNAGTILRSADAAGVDAVLMCGSVDPFNPKTVRASAGSIFHVPLVVMGGADEAISTLHARGLEVFAAASVGVDYTSLDLRGPHGFVLGNEAAGLAPQVRDLADATVAIPMAGQAESLNVGVACALLCFESLRQRRAAGTQRAPLGPPDVAARQGRVASR